MAASSNDSSNHSNSSNIYNCNNNYNCNMDECSFIVAVPRLICGLQRAHIKLMWHHWQRQPDRHRSRAEAWAEGGVCVRCAWGRQRIIERCLALDKQQRIRLEQCAPYRLAAIECGLSSSVPLPPVCLSVCLHACLSFPSPEHPNFLACCPASTRQSDKDKQNGALCRPLAKLWGHTAFRLGLGMQMHACIPLSRSLPGTYCDCQSAAAPSHPSQSPLPSTRYATAARLQLT